MITTERRARIHSVEMVNLLVFACKMCHLNGRKASTKYMYVHYTNSFKEVTGLSFIDIQGLLIDFCREIPHRKSIYLI